MGLVFGIGSGLFSLSMIWIAGILAILFLSRTGKQPLAFGIGVLLVLISFIMALWPRGSEDEVYTEVSDNKIDHVAIPRAVYAVFISLFMLIAIVAYILDHVLMKNVAKAAKIKKSYTF